MHRTADLTVIGGGIHGCSAALHAAMRGMSVIVLEKDTAGRHASGVNAGGVRRLGRHPAEVPISQRSIDIWYRIARAYWWTTIAGSNGHLRSMWPKPRSSSRAFAAASPICKRPAFTMKSFSTRRVCARSCRRSRRIVLARRLSSTMVSPQPYQTTFAFQRKARALGVTFYENTAAERIAHENGVWTITTREGVISGDRLLNAAGAWGGEIARQLGEPVPIEAIAPMMIVTSRMPHFCDAVVGSAGRPLSFKQMPNGTVVIGGGRRGRADPPEIYRR